MIIYKATNSINGKSYIGQSSFSLKKRMIEHKKSWSESHKGRKNGMFGKKHSIESKELMSKNRKGLSIGDNNPSAINSDTYKIYPPRREKPFIIKNLRKFCRENKLNRTEMYRICNKKRSKKFKGYWVERIF
jgi:hypothetical protein